MTVTSPGIERAIAKLDPAAYFGERILSYPYVGLADIALVGTGSYHTDCWLSPGDI